MKLLRYGTVGDEKPAALDANGIIRDLSAHIDDINYNALNQTTLDRLGSLDLSSLPAISNNPRLGAPIADIRKIVCIGLNYSDHAEESGMAIPSEPVVFMKADTSICGPNDDVQIPKGSTKLDWEVELGIVISKTTRYVSEAEAMDHVAGYMVVNDISERAFQLDNTGQWVKGKSHDTFCPIGPVLTTRDEIKDVQNLSLWLDIDGERVQSGNTSTMIFSVAAIVSYLSQHMTLRAGDLIPTGTPPGVGLGFKPPRYLKEGEVMTVGIQDLGEISQKVVSINQ